MVAAGQRVVRFAEIFFGTAAALPEAFSIGTVLDLKELSGHF
jgi:hypothetical protein